MYKVKDVADMAGISVRTLHHYDHIGLLVPEMVSENGYRHYSDRNLSTLQRIMFLKELDFTLKEIREMIDRADSFGTEMLIRQKELLKLKRDRLDRILETIDRTIASENKGRKMDIISMFEGFDMKEIEAHQKKYAEEVEERYGSSEAFRESSAKTKNYTKDDWEMIKKESDEILKSLALKMELDPADRAVQDVIARWQSHITERYYNCTKEILAGLGETYADDERFRENIDKFGEGLAVFFRDAIRIYCA